MKEGYNRRVTLFGEVLFNDSNFLVFQFVMRLLERLVEFDQVLLIIGEFIVDFIDWLLDTEALQQLQAKYRWSIC